MPLEPATSPFAFDWDAPLQDDARERMLNAMVSLVRRYRLEVPAVLLLETSAPLSHLFGQGLVAFSPFVAPLLPSGPWDVQRWAKFLDTPANVRLLIDRLTQDNETL